MSIATARCYRFAAALLLAAAAAGAADGLKAPVDHKSPVTFGPPGCPVLVVGDRVWDLKQNKEARQLEGVAELRGHRALSADGKWFATASKQPNQTDTAVAVWSTETGKKVLDVPGKAKEYVDVMAFAGEKALALGGRHSNKIDLWDVEAGKVVKTLTVPDRRVETDKLAFSPDGRSFACIAHDKIVLTDAGSGKQLRTLDPPGAPAPKGAPAAKRPGGIDVIFVYARTSAMAFSPDGEELAAFSTHPQPRLMVWSAKGKLLMDEPVPMPQVVSHSNTLDWLPDKTGWLVNGHLYDRASKRVALSVKMPFASPVPAHLLDKDRIAAVFASDESQLQTVTIPWKELTASLKHMGTKPDAFVSPSQPLSLEVDVTAARADAEATRKLLIDAVTQRLARDGIKVAEGAPTVLRLKLAEEAGETLPIYERQSPFDFRGRDTGRKATEAKGAAVLELVARGTAEPLWRGHLTAQSARSFSEEITDVSIRKTMLEHLTRQLSSIDMPYFLPRSKDHVALPAVID
jgi:hypothetical protein